MCPPEKLLAFAEGTNKALKSTIMKKTFVIFAVLVVTVFASCKKTSQNVTVFRKSTDFASQAAKLTWNLHYYDAVAISGDTIRVQVSDDIALAHKLPFKGHMVQDAGLNDATITAAEDIASPVAAK